MMKLLTLNAHSILEEDYERKLVSVAEFALRKQIDLIALQEVNQSADAPEAGAWLTEGMFPLGASEIPVRADNHAAWTAYLLRQTGLVLRWVWLPVKLGYGRFDEGLAILSLNRDIVEADARCISRSEDYLNWKTRYILGARLEGMEDWFYSVHMGWWDDQEDPFSEQWARMNRAMEEKRQSNVWLMGDFNSPAEYRGEGYDLIRACGWKDAFLMAEKTRGCATVRGGIDGWRDAEKGGLRIDHIFCSRPVRVLSASAVFDGEHEKQVSDHFGILVETDCSHQEE